MEALVAALADLQHCCYHGNVVSSPLSGNERGQDKSCFLTIYTGPWYSHSNNSHCSDYVSALTLFYEAIFSNMNVGQEWDSTKPLPPSTVPGVRMAQGQSDHLMRTGDWFAIICIIWTSTASQENTPTQNPQIPAILSCCSVLDMYFLFYPRNPQSGLRSSGFTSVLFPRIFRSPSKGFWPLWWSQTNGPGVL